MVANPFTTVSSNNENLAVIGLAHYNNSYNSNYVVCIILKYLLTHYESSNFTTKSVA